MAGRVLGPIRHGLSNRHGAGVESNTWNTHRVGGDRGRMPAPPARRRQGGGKTAPFSQRSSATSTSWQGCDDTVVVGPPHESFAAQMRGSEQRLSHERLSQERRTQRSGVSSGRVDALSAAQGVPLSSRKLPPLGPIAPVLPPSRASAGALLASSSASRSSSSARPLSAVAAAGTLSNDYRVSLIVSSLIA